MRWLILLLLPFRFLFAAEVAKDHDVVHVHYVGTFDDGSVFDESTGRNPLSFKVGLGQVVPGFESAVRGMKIGETKNVRILAKDAYGPRDPSLVQRIQKDRLPQGNLEVGMQLMGYTAQGDPQILTIQEIHPNYIVIDQNHPMAGKDLNFKITLVSIENR